MTLSKQKTFSIALSRDMIPEAHIVVWHIYQDEVISDSMNFFVNGTRINKVSYLMSSMYSSRYQEIAWHGKI